MATTDITLKGLLNTLTPLLVEIENITPDQDNFFIFNLTKQVIYERIHHFDESLKEFNRGGDRHFIYICSALRQMSFKPLLFIKALRGLQVVDKAKLGKKESMKVQRVLDRASTLCYEAYSDQPSAELARFINHPDKMAHGELEDPHEFGNIAVSCPGSLMVCDYFKRISQIPRLRAIELTLDDKMIEAGLMKMSTIGIELFEPFHKMEVYFDTKPLDSDEMPARQIQEPQLAASEIIS